jgi:RecA-family ATPase
MNSHTEEQNLSDPKSNPYAERIKSFSITELTSDPQPAKFIWPGIPDEAGKVSVFVGVGGLGKSALTIGIACQRALGLNFLGRPTKPGTTVVISKEDSREDYLRKVAAQRELLGSSFDAEKIRERIHLMDLVGDPAMLVQSSYGAATAVNQEVVKMWADAVNGSAPNADLIILETGSRLTPTEDNSGLSALVNGCELLGRLTGCVVLLVHHTGKEAGRNGASDLYTGRGGSALADNARAVMVLTSYPRDRDARERLGVAVPEDMARRTLVLSVPKLNGAPPPPPLVIEKVATPWAMTLRVVDREALARAEREAHKHRVAEGVREVTLLVQAANERKETVTRRSIEKREVEGIDAELYPKELLAYILDQALEWGALEEVPGPRKNCIALRANVHWFLDRAAANEAMKNEESAA